MMKFVEREWHYGVKAEDGRDFVVVDRVIADFYDDVNDDQFEVVPAIGEMIILGQAKYRVTDVLNVYDIDNGRIADTTVYIRSTAAVPEPDFIA